MKLEERDYRMYGKIKEKQYSELGDLMDYVLIMKNIKEEDRNGLWEGFNIRYHRYASVSELLDEKHLNMDDFLLIIYEKVR